MQTEQFEKLYERLLNLATHKLRDSALAKAVVDDTIYQLRTTFSKNAVDSGLITRAMRILDEKLHQQLTFEAAITGSKPAETQFFETLRLRLIATANAARLLEPAMVEDAVQDTLMVVSEKFKTIDTPIIPFAQKVLKFITMNHLRKKKSLTFSSQLSESGDESTQEFIDRMLHDDHDASEHANANRLKERLLLAVSRMKADDKQLFSILLESGDRQDVLAAFPDVNPNTIDARIRRLRDKLRDVMDDLGM